MASEENKQIVRRYYEELINQGNLAAADALFAAHYVLHDPTTPPGLPPGPEGIKQLLAMYRAGVPDSHLTVEEMIAAGDKVVTRHIGRGTHQGDLMGMPPTGKHLTVPGILISRISGGKIVEQWQNFDALGLLQQLGVIPTPGEAGA